MTRSHLLALLEPQANTGYLAQPLPCARDHELRTLLRSAKPADLLNELTVAHAPVLRAFAERAASLAVHTSDAHLLRTGLTALALADLTSRETLVILPLYGDAAERIGVEVRLLFGAVANACGEPIATHLAAFLQRAPHDRSLTSMGYVTDGEGPAFRYSRRWE
jgi:hypothetical protein